MHGGRVAMHGGRVAMHRGRVAMHSGRVAMHNVTRRAVLAVRGYISAPQMLM
jgi:hypothetical protein